MGCCSGLLHPRALCLMPAERHSASAAAVAAAEPLVEFCPRPAAGWGAIHVAALDCHFDTRTHRGCHCIPQTQPTGSHRHPLPVGPSAGTQSYIFLIAGPEGSGKTTLMSAMVEWLERCRPQSGEVWKRFD